jgi:DHA1 family tetracycline resistance protein-like MFS transporter
METEAVASHERLHNGDSDVRGPAAVPLWRLPVAYPGILRVVFLLATMVTVPNVIGKVVLTPLLGKFFTGKDQVEIAGACGSVKAVIGFFAAALIGRLSDKIGRKPLLIYALVVGVLPGLSLMISGTKTGVWAYFVLDTFLTGLTAASANGSPVFHAAITDQVPAENVMAAFAMTFALGPILAVVLMNVPNLLGVGQAGGTVYAVVLTGLGIAITLGLPEARQPETPPEDASGGFANPFAPLLGALRNRPLALLCLVAAFLQLGESMPNSQSMFHYLAKLQGLDLGNPEDAQKVALMMTMLLSIMMLVTVPVTLLLPLLIKRMAPERVLLASIVLAAVAAVSPTFAELGVPVFVVAVFLAAMLTPFIALQSLVPRTAASDGQIGECMGAVAAAKQLVSVFASYSEAKIYNALDLANVPWLAFVLFAGITACAIVPALLLSSRWARAPPRTERREGPRPIWHPLQVGRSSLHGLWALPSSVAAFAVTVTLLSLGLGTLFLCVGVLVLVVLGQLLVRLAQWDLQTAAWALNEPVVGPCASAPSSPLKVGVVGFLRELRGSCVLRLLVFYTLVNLPMSMAFFILSVAFIVLPPSYIAVPILYLFGVPGLCIDGGGFGITDECKGMPINTPLRSLYPFLLGLLLLPLCAMLLSMLSRLRARMLKAVLAETSLHVSTPSVTSGISGD